MQNFDIDQIDNLIPLNTPFHAKHPAYSDYVGKRLNEMAKGNNNVLTSTHISAVTSEMEMLIQKARNSGLKLNDYIKSL